MADGASLPAFIGISISTHFVFQAEIKIIEAVPGRGSATPRAPLLLCILTELPASKPRTTYSCGSLVHPRGWYFANLEDEGVCFFFLWNIALQFAAFSGHMSSWNVWASTSVVSIYVHSAGLLGSPVGTLSVNVGNLRTVRKNKGPLSTLSSRRMPAASFQQVIVMRTSLSISPCRSCRCKVPRVGNVALKPCTISPLLAPIQVLQPPVGWLSGCLFIPNIPKMWLQRVKPFHQPALYGHFQTYWQILPPPLASPSLVTGAVILGNIVAR